MEIKKSVKISSHSKKWTIINAKKVNYSDAETIYYGKGKVQKTWLVRIYNKIKDCVAKKKIIGYEHYIELEQVTRLELEIRSSTCNEYQISFPEILDKDRVWSIFYQLLAKNKFTKWGIAKRLNTIFKKQGFINYQIKHKNLSTNQLSRMGYIKRLKSMQAKAVNIYGKYLITYL